MKLLHPEPHKPMDGDNMLPINISKNAYTEHTMGYHSQAVVKV